jgi:hypothetical protein
MTRQRGLRGFFLALLLIGLGQTSRAQKTAQVERTYPQPKSVVEKAVKALQPSMSGRLPVLDGFALPGDHPLSRYQRAYYQSTVQVTSTSSGEALVRVSAKVTAWYTDSTPSRSGYQVLTSNGRLESDLLDQLADRLADAKSGGSAQVSGSAIGTEHSMTSEKAAAEHGGSEPEISAPTPQLPESEGTFSSSRSSSRPTGRSTQAAQQKPSDKKAAISSVPSAFSADLQAEAASLEEVLKNQAHPKNLVAIKKSGTPVVASPSLTGKTLFLASTHDEFEMLDFNADWVHVRISGLSRGWIWRTSLEMPEGISDVPANSPTNAPVVAELFQVTREETAPFPGDWEALRGKNVKIISVQKIQEDEKNSGAQAKLEFVKSLLEKNYAELASKTQELAGVVMIFDSVDGGMIAITLPTVQQWKAGKLTDAALWHRCFFDPPETFTVPGSAGGQ